MESVLIRAHSLSDSQTSKHTGCPKNVLVFDKQQNIGLLFDFCHFFCVC